MQRSPIKALVIGAVAALAVQFASADTMRLAHGLAEDHPVHKAMVKFAELAKAKTKGEIEIKIFPNGTLGGERETLEQVQNGVLEMTKASASPVWTAREIERSYRARASVTVWSSSRRSAA